MKVGKRLETLIDLLEDVGRADGSVFVSRAGMAGERVETDIRKLRGKKRKRDIFPSSFREWKRRT